MLACSFRKNKNAFEFQSSLAYHSYIVDANALEVAAICALQSNFASSQAVWPSILYGTARICYHALAMMAWQIFIR